MAGVLKDINSVDFSKLPKPRPEEFFGIVLSEWNLDITKRLAEGAYKTLSNAGVYDDRIFFIRVPGSFELTFGAKFLIENCSNLTAVIAIGCVIKGETPHFHYVSRAVTDGIRELNVQYDVPVIFSVLTVNNKEQALARAGGYMGNKGVEGAVAALQMSQYARYLSRGVKGKFQELEKYLISNMSANDKDYWLGV